MKIKSGIINNGLQTIIDISEKSMPISLAAKFLRLADELTKENEFIEKQRIGIIEKYGDKDEQGNLDVQDGNVKFSNPENAEKAQQELNELSELEVDIVDRNITEEELMNSGLELTIVQFAALKEFIHTNK